MGGHCAICKSYQPITQVLTVDQKPAKKASDVLGFILGCGHKFGNEDFMQIQEAVNELKLKHARHLAELEREFKADVAKTLAPLSSRGDAS